MAMHLIVKEVTINSVRTQTMDEYLIIFLNLDGKALWLDNLPYAALN